MVQKTFGMLEVDAITALTAQIAAKYDEHAFQKYELGATPDRKTAIEQATISLSILREHIDQFDLVMVDGNMLEMDYLEFIKSTQLIKDKPIISELDKKLDEVVRELEDKASTKNVLERMCVQDLTKECLTYHLKKYRSQKRQAPNVEPITSTNFNEEHHSNVLNSSNFSADVNELFQGAYIPQPLEVPLVALPSSNDYSLNECDEWINEFLELDDLS
ncbi:hypothetical protein MTR67_001911 [Solanum verrucosum]|uniref:Uncharacterized protein n=1 Tax=Solanum verrucosum TaxID=315347 RepID=A0AAF0T7X1_SOLVR|nr:hypothetical protein MTR67_001911 [Solanum verrucosum]